MRTRTRKIALGTLMMLVIGAFATHHLMGQDADQGRPESPGSLEVVQDESSMEEKIARYLRTEKELKLEETYLDAEKKDKVILMGWAGGQDAPEFKIFIDTQATARTPDGRVAERMIRIKGIIILPKSAKTFAARQRILELNNRFLQKVWAPDRVLLDSDGDVVFETSLNSLPGAPVSLLTIDDALFRMLKSRKNYYKQLRTVVDLD